MDNDFPEQRNLIIIIVNYKSFVKVNEFLREYKTPVGIITRFVIVDSFYDLEEQNNIEKIVDKNNHLIINFLKSKENLGYAGGNNKAYDLILKNNWKGNILILNPDVQIDSNSILKLYRSLRDDIAIVTPRTLGLNDVVLYDVISLKGFFSHLKARSIIGLHNTDYAVGCCLMINRTFLEKNNFEKLFKTEYFMYWEEVDFSFRVLDLNYRCVCNNDSFIVREENPPSSMLNQIYFLLRNSFYIKKYYPSKFTTFEHLYYILYYFLVSLKYMIKLRNINILIKYFKGLNDGFKL